MEFSNRLSISNQPVDIVSDLTKDLSDTYDLGILFVAHLSQESIRQILDGIYNRLKITHLVGCTSAGVIGSHQEIEQQPAASLILAKLPNVKITPFGINQNQLENLNAKKDWYEYFEIFPTENPVFLVFPDPFLLDMNRFLQGMNEAYPNCSVIGGLASASQEPKGNILFLDGEMYDDGIVGLTLTGDINVRTVVSQGCRPIGETYIVTKAEDNIIYELAGRPFLKVLQDVLDKASAKDKLLAQEAILVGIAMDEYTHQYKRGDFVVRGLMGVDQGSGAGAIGDYIKVGQTIQFHVRDAETATEDLNELLKQQQGQVQSLKPKGALVFSCNGRGEYLFKKKNHDISIIQSHVGPIPAAGFFCAGEIGPVGKINFVHGFTDSIALFYPKN